jgi:hypothetical protein
MGRTLDSLDIDLPSLRTPPLTATEQSLNVVMEEKIILKGRLARLNETLESHGVGIATSLPLEMED